MTRYFGEKREIRTDKVREFYESRASNIIENDARCLLNATMLQDFELSKERHSIEVELVKRVISENSLKKLLDIGCGTGRLCGEIVHSIESYVGVDFIQKFIDIANDKFRTVNNASFICMQAPELTKDKLPREFDLVIISGLLMYLNDLELQDLLTNVVTFLTKGVIYIREPIAIDTRLTLSETWSNELNHCYSAIYRTKQEMEEFFEILSCGKTFTIREQGYMYPEHLNNRIETIQYYWCIGIST